MPAQGLFVNFSLDTVLAIQKRAEKLILDGKTIMSYGDQGTNVSKQFTLPIADVLLECNHALKVLDPDKYGSAVGSRRVHSNYGSVDSAY